MGSALLLAQGLDEADIAQNRGGRLSASQRERFASEMHVRRPGLILLLGLGLPVGIALGVLAKGGAVAQSIGVAFAIGVFAVPLTFVARAYLMRRYAEIEKGVVASAVGTIGGINAAFDSGLLFRLDGRMMSCWGMHQLANDLRDGMRARVFFLPGSRLVVAVEDLDDAGAPVGSTGTM